MIEVINGVDARRLARPGGARDQDVGHVGQVLDDRPAGDVASQRHLEGDGWPCGPLRSQDVAQRHQLAQAVGDLDPDGRLARDGGQDAHVGRRHGVGDVLGQARDPGHLHPGPELELEAGHGGTHGVSEQSGLDTVRGQSADEGAAGVLIGARRAPGAWTARASSPEAGASLRRRAQSIDERRALARRAAWPRVGSQARLSGRSRLGARSPRVVGCRRRRPRPARRGRRASGGPTLRPEVTGRLDLDRLVLVVLVVVRRRRPDGALRHGRRPPHRSHRRRRGRAARSHAGEQHQGQSDQGEQDDRGPAVPEPRSQGVAEGPRPSPRQRTAARSMPPSRGAPPARSASPATEAAGSGANRRRPGPARGRASAPTRSRPPAGRHRHQGDEEPAPPEDHPEPVTQPRGRPGRGRCRRGQAARIPRVTSPMPQTSST